MTYSIPGFELEAVDVDFADVDSGSNVFVGKVFVDRHGVVIAVAPAIGWTEFDVEKFMLEKYDVVEL